MTSFDTSIQAIYADGFILSEAELNDTNPYGEGNTFTAVYNKLPEEEHGKLMVLTVFWKGVQTDLVWPELPEGARPIRFRHGYLIQTGPRAGESGWSGVDFGYQWNDKDGKNHEVVEELR